MDKDYAFDLFYKTGNIEAYLLYKEYELAETKAKETPNKMPELTVVAAV